MGSAQIIRVDLVKKSVAESCVEKLLAQEINLLMNRYVFVLHDYLLTPITHVIGFSQLLQNEKIAGNPARRKKYLKIVLDESTRLYVNVEKIVMFLNKWDVDTINKMNLKDSLMIVEKETANYLQEKYPRANMD